MTDYSDLLFTMAAILIFSLFLLQANQAMVRNDVVTVDNEYEKTAISVAQSVIDEARNKVFDQTLLDGEAPSTLPDGFRLELGPTEGLTRSDFEVFDHYHGYSETVETQLGDYVVDVNVSYVSDTAPFTEVTGPTFRKKMEVRVRQADANGRAQLNYIKTYF